MLSSPPFISVQHVLEQFLKFGWMKEVGVFPGRVGHLLPLLETEHVREVAAQLTVPRPHLLSGTLASVLSNQAYDEA